MRRGLFGINMGACAEPETAVRVAFALDLERTRACLAGLEQAARAVERPRKRRALEISVTPSLRLDRDVARRFEDLGISRLVPIARGASAEALVGFVEQTAAALGS